MKNIGTLIGQTIFTLIVFAVISLIITGIFAILFWFLSLFIDYDFNPFAAMVGFWVTVAVFAAAQIIKKKLKK